MHRINYVALRELHRSLPAAQKLIAMLAEQDSPAEWVTVDELEALDVGRRNAIDLLRALEEHGVGEFRVGRKGHPSRFVWAIDPRQLVMRLRGEARADEHEDEDEDEASALESGEDEDEDEDAVEADDDGDADESEQDDEDEPRPQLALALQQELDRRMSKLVPAPAAPTKGRAHARAHAEPSPSEPAPRKQPGDMTEHVFVLRPGMSIRVSLPNDLTPREAVVLGDWVRNLSFDR